MVGRHIASVIQRFLGCAGGESSELTRGCFIRFIAVPL